MHAKYRGKDENLSAGEDGDEQGGDNEVKSDGDYLGIWAKAGSV